MCAEIEWSSRSRNLPPGTNLLSAALRDVAKGSAGAESAAINPQAADRTPAADAHKNSNVPDGASVHSMKIPGLERLAMRMDEGRRMSPLASMPRRMNRIQTASLPAAGTRSWKLAKAKAEVHASSLQLKLDKERRRLDVEQAAYSKLYKGTVGSKLEAKEVLAERVKKEIFTAKAMEAQARKLSDKVVTDLHVKKGHYDIKQWYRSQSAYKSSQESTTAVKEAKELWAKAMTDRQTLQKMSGDEAFKVQAGQMERDRVRVDISKGHGHQPGQAAQGKRAPQRPPKQGCILPQAACQAGAAGARGEASATPNN